MQFVSQTSRRRINSTALNMSSMIDVTFLLLIYFIVTTVFTPPEDQLTPALQVEQGLSTIVNDFEPQIVIVDLQNNTPVYQIGERIFTNRKQLASILSSLPHEPGVIIRVGDKVSVEFAIAAVQEARNAGFERVTYVPATR